MRHIKKIELCKNILANALGNSIKDRRKLIRKDKINGHQHLNADDPKMAFASGHLG